MTIKLGADVFTVAVGIYAFATILYVVYLFSKQKALADAGRGVLIAGFIAHTASLAIRGIVLGRAPFLNMYEYMLSFVWGAVAVYLGVEIITKNRSFGAFAVPLITFMAFMAARLPYELIDIMPALRSAWRLPHIFSGIMAYGAFLVSLMMSVMLLWVEYVEKKKNDTSAVTRLPGTKSIELAIYRTVAFGFLMQTLLIVVGAIWAERSWGRPWGWDPKETWSLITWLVCAAYLHTRTTMKWRGGSYTFAMTFLIYAATMFTLYGVNLLGGLHAYSK